MAVKGQPLKFVYHAVMDVSDHDCAGPWEPGEKKICKIVFIGKALDQEYIRNNFEKIFEPLPAMHKKLRMCGENVAEH